MDARLDTLSDELCQVNTHGGHITWRQATMGGFTAYTSPSPLASEDESDDGFGNDDVDEDDGASSPSDDEISTWCTYPLSLVTKRGNSFDMRVVIGDFCDKGSVYTMRDVVRFLCIFLFFLSHLPHVYWSYDHLTYIVLIFGFIYIDICYLPIFTCVVSFLSLCTCFLHCMQFFISISH